MRQSMRFATVILLLVATIGGCAGPAPTREAPMSPSNDRPGLAISAVAHLPADPAAARRAADAINAFGLDLLGAATAGDENAVVSPASIVLALAMARAGARGDTAAEMDEVLRAVAADENAAWLASLDALLATRSGTFTGMDQKPSDVTLRIVNAPFAQADYPWEQPYLDALAARFGAGVRLVDYVNETEAARQSINGWVRENTEGRIPELLDPGALNPLSRLALVNAIYLKASWRKQFRSESTVPAPFRRLDGSTVEVSTMQGTVSVGLAEGDGWLAVDIPFVGEQLSMLLLVPDDLPAFEGALDADRLAAIVEELEDESVTLSMPRFGIETKLNLKDTLADLGMPTPFDLERADFSGMTLAAQLYITAVIHQANIDIDETGAEAAAATAVLLQAVSAPRPLRIDRPFLFVLRDRETGAVLFLGRVVEPVER